MTRPTPPTCPECGASHDGRDTDAVFKDCDNWKCGSWRVVDSGCFHQSKQCQEDSLVLRIASLTRQLAERDEKARDLEQRLLSVRQTLEDAVCTEGIDKGVVMLSDDGPTHPEEINGQTVQVYDHEYFSPLGDALIKAWELTNYEAAPQ